MTLVVVWCRNGIRYNNDVPTSVTEYVVVWCRNGIRYNAAGYFKPGKMLWFDVEME